MNGQIASDLVLGYIGLLGLFGIVGSVLSFWYLGRQNHNKR